MKTTNRLPIAIGVIAGLLSGPAIALGASAMLSSGEPAPAPAAAPAAIEIAQPATTTTALPTTAQPTTPPATTVEHDLMAACGVDGLSLVTAEDAGTATDLELAALDALRDVCTEAGLPLPAARTMITAAPEEIIVYETVDVPAAAAAAPAASYVDDDEYEEHDEHDEDDDHYSDDDDDSHSEEG